MDIIGISNDNYRQFMTETQRQQSTIENFQSLLEKAASAETVSAEVTSAEAASQAASKTETVGGGVGVNGATAIDPEDQALREACASFESYFLQMMFREMRKTSFDQDGFIAKSNAEKIFTDMMDEETARNAAKSGGIGLADMMYKQMTQYKTSVNTQTERL